MGHCEDCDNFEYRCEDYDEFDRYDYRKNWCKFYKRVVSRTGSCKMFSEALSFSNSGYKDDSPKKKSDDCFLTSALVSYLNKPDDCDELTTLRRFRDEYMKSTEEGTQLVDEYYKIAPIIVEKIETSGKREVYYKYINEVVERCIKLFNINENERVLNEYKFMVINLKKEFAL
jgi:hypothetical protein